MYKMIKAGLLALGIVAAAVANAGELSQKSVKALLDSVDAAANSQNVEQIASSMSDNVEIVINVTMQGQTQVMQITKPQYIEMLKQGWAEYSDYKYTRSSTKIDIKGDKAIATATVKESMTVQGQKVSSVTREEATIELVKGEPRVTKLVGYTSM